MFAYFFKCKPECAHFLDSYFSHNYIIFLFHLLFCCCSLSRSEIFWLPILSCILHSKHLRSSQTNPVIFSLYLFCSFCSLYLFREREARSTHESEPLSDYFGFSQAWKITSSVLPVALSTFGLSARLSLCLPPATLSSFFLFAVSLRRTLLFTAQYFLSFSTYVTHGRAFGCFWSKAGVTFACCLIWRRMFHLSYRCACRSVYVRLLLSFLYAVSLGQHCWFDKVGHVFESLAQGK